MRQPTKEEFAAMHRAWKPWGTFGWNVESFALGWFLGLGYKREEARRAVEKVEQIESTKRSDG